MTTEEFKTYQQQKIHIDILSSGEILFKGNRLHPKDLNTSLRNTAVSADAMFILSLSDYTPVGPVFDIKTFLSSHYPIGQIAFKDQSHYQF